MINRRFCSESLHINYKTDSLGSIVGESRPDEGTPDTQYNMLFKIKQTEQRRHRLRTVYCCHLRGSKRLLGHDSWPCIPSAWASTRSGRLKNGSTALYFECTRRIHCCVQDGGWWNRHERGDAGRSSHSQNNTNTSPEAGSRKDSVAGVRLTEVPRRVVRPGAARVVALSRTVAGTPPVVAGWLEVVVEQNKWVSHSAHARPQRRRDATGPLRAKPNPTEAVPPLRKASCHPKMPRQGRQDLLPSAAAFKVRTSPFFC